MFTKRIITGACAAALLTTISAAPARAQGPVDQRTEFTFNQSVEMPGVTLPPGTYIFRFVDATTSRQVMQIQAKDQSNKNYGLFLTISAQRPRPSDQAELRFMETPAGQPAAVKTWWYPGRTIGREFIYPKSQARRLAQATNQNVLTTKADTVSDDQMKTTELSYVSAGGQETPLSDEELVARAANTPPVGTAGASSTETAQSDRVAATSGVQQEGTMTSNRTRLPKTSTALPIVGVMGLLSLLGGAALRFRA